MTHHNRGTGGTVTVATCLATNLQLNRWASEYALKHVESSMGVRIACPIAPSGEMKCGFALTLAKLEKRVFQGFTKRVPLWECPD